MRYALTLFALAVLASVLVARGADAQGAGAFASIGETQDALREALRQQRLAQQRSRQLETAAASTTEQVEKTRREAAVLASRLQETEAALAAAGARIALVDRQYAGIRSRLAERQRPLIGLTAALQNFTRRPLVFAVLRPGSLQDAVYTRAIFATALPEVERRTTGLRAELNEARALREEALEARNALARLDGQLEERQKQLAALESRQQLEQRQAAGAADRESERVLALAEQARDLDSLIGELDRAGGLREELAALAGPIPRPARPARSVVAEASPAPASVSSARPPAGYRLPVTGRVLAGFGAPVGGGTSKGLVLGPPQGAVVIAPAEGRVAFSGPYRGYGRIVIIEHAGGWTSLVTGLARSDVVVGEQLVAGAPLGVAPRSGPRVTLELRHDGEPVNPLPFIG